MEEKEESKEEKKEHHNVEVKPDNQLKIEPEESSDSSLSTGSRRKKKPFEIKVPVNEKPKVKEPKARLLPSCK